ncbi:MAG: hypothetical protein QGG74_00255 [Phycisphaerales bacterium]|jgi:hypothetical protein|nr:hypothetical protein [Phycisphaerales bacterium]
MTTDDHNATPNPAHLAEARASKQHVRRQLQAIIDEHIVDDLVMHDDTLETSLFADLPWKDPSPSGEFEAIEA